MAKILKNIYGFKKVVVEVSRCQNTTKITPLQNVIASNYLEWLRNHSVWFSGTLNINWFVVLFCIWPYSIIGLVDYQGGSKQFPVASKT